MIKVRDLVDGVATRERSPWPDFREAWEVQRVIDALVESDRRGGWTAVADVDAGA